ncbi:MAG: hypothetical protein ACLTU3_07995 [Acutalibacteraceae bacterium]
MENVGNIVLCLLEKVGNIVLAQQENSGSEACAFSQNLQRIFMLFDAKYISCIL